MLSIYAVAMPVTRFVAPGPLVANHTCFSCGAGVAVGRVCGPLFVSRHYVAYLAAVLVERIIQIQYRTAGIAKQRLDALFHQNFCKNVRACQYHTCALLLPSFSL